MTLPFWGQQEKAQDDATTIEERIAEMIVEHEEDPEAHLGAGESLEAHKSESVIDHPPLSVLRDKIAFDRRIFDYYFSSLDGVNVSAGVELNTCGVLLMTTSGALNNQRMFQILTDDINFYSAPMSKLPVFEISINIPTITNTKIYVLNGSDSDWSGFGFAVENGDFQAVYFDSSNTEHSQDVDSLSANTTYRIRVEYKSDGKIYWSKDGVEIYSLTPSSLSDPQAFFTILVKATSAVVRSAYFASLHFDADY
jgi:hypothetical protein